MKVVYDPATDTLTVVLKEVRIADSEEASPGTLLDYDSGGNLVALEVLDASRRVQAPERVEFELAS